MSAASVATPITLKNDALTLAQIEQIVQDKRNIPASKLLNIYVFGSRLYSSHLVPRPALLSQYMSQMTHVYNNYVYYDVKDNSFSLTAQQQHKAKATVKTTADYDLYIVVDYDSECRDLLNNKLDPIQVKLPSNVVTSEINPVTRLLLVDSSQDKSATPSAIGVDITFRTREEFFRDCNQLEEVAVLFLSLQKHPKEFSSQFIFKEVEKPVVEFPLFSVNNEKWQDYEKRKEFYNQCKLCSEISFERARRQLQKQDMYNAIKNYFHAIRNLVFKVQIVTHGYITDFSCGNTILKEMYNCFETAAEKCKLNKVSDFKNLMTMIQYEQMSKELSNILEAQYVQGQAVVEMRKLRFEMKII